MTLTHHSNSNAFLLLTAAAADQHVRFLRRDGPQCSCEQRRGWLAYLRVGQPKHRPRAQSRTETQTQASRHQLRVGTCCATSRARASWEPWDKARVVTRSNQFPEEQASDEQASDVVGSWLRCFRILRLDYAAQRAYSAPTRQLLPHVSAQYARSPAQMKLPSDRFHRFHGKLQLSSRSGMLTQLAW